MLNAATISPKKPITFTGCFALLQHNYDLVCFQLKLKLSMQILMQIENAVCVFYLINTSFATHYPYPVFWTMQQKIVLQCNEKPPQFSFNNNIEWYLRNERRGFSRTNELKRTKVSIIGISSTRIELKLFFRFILASKGNQTALSWSLHFDISHFSHSVWFVSLFSSIANSIFRFNVPV